MKNKINSRRSSGISLIALIVTIIVIIILSSIVYFSTNDALNSMSEAKFKTELRGLQDRLKIYHERANAKSENYKSSKLVWDGESERATNTGKVEDGVNEDTAEYIFGEITEYFKDRVIINNGELSVKGKKLSNDEMKWAREIEVASNYDYINNYTQLEYIESTRTQYIDLHYIPKTNTVTELELSFSGTFKYGDDLKGNYTGAFLGVNENLYCYSINFGGNSYQYNELYPWFNRTYNNNETAVANKEDFNITDSIRTQRNLLKIEPGKISYGTVSRNITVKSADQTQSMFIFGHNSLNSAVQKRAFAAYDMKVYSLKLYEGSTLCRNYIPCYCNTDVRNIDGVLCPAGTLGLYETVNGDFYTNSGTGTFNAGPEI